MRPSEQELWEYLLGGRDLSESIQIGIRRSRDDDFERRVQEAKASLIEEYTFGLLSPEDERRFRLHLLPEEGVAEKVAEIVECVARGTDRTPDIEDQPKAEILPFRKPLNNNWAAWGLAAAAMVTLIVAVESWRRVQPKPSKEVAQVVPPAAAIPPGPANAEPAAPPKAEGPVYEARVEAAADGLMGIFISKPRLVRKDLSAPAADVQKDLIPESCWPKLPVEYDPDGTDPDGVVRGTLTIRETIVRGYVERSKYVVLTDCGGTRVGMITAAPKGRVDPGIETDSLKHTRLFAVYVLSPAYGEWVKARTRPDKGIREYRELERQARERLKEIREMPDGEAPNTEKRLLERWLNGPP